MAEKLHKGHLPLLMQPPQGDGHKPIKCRVGEENGMIARIIRTILQYPVGAEVGFTDEFTTEYRTVTGYQYSHGAFYVIFSERSMVHMRESFLKGTGRRCWKARRFCGRRNCLIMI